MLIQLWGHLRYFLTDFSLYLALLAVSTFFCVYGSLKLYKSALSEKKKGALIGLCFTFLALVYSYSAFEAYFRYRYDESDGLGFLETTERWTARHVAYNNYQYRDRNFTLEKTPGVVRIGVMGDSNAYGAGIKNVYNRFSNVLEKMLNDHGYKAEVYNFGVPGLNTDTEIKEYSRVEQLNFDILVWSYFFNDAEESANSAGTAVLQTEQTRPPGIITTLTDQSFFFDYIYWRLAAKYETAFIKIRNADLDQYNNPSVFQYHKQLIDSFSSSLLADNKKFVMLVVPFLYFFPNYPAQALAIDERMDKIFTDDGASAVVDLLPYVHKMQAKDLIVSKYDSHPNIAIHKLAAEKLYDAITPLLSVDSNGNTTVKQ